jgi:hypothetical protein
VIGTILGRSNLSTVGHIISDRNSSRSGLGGLALRGLAVAALAVSVAGCAYHFDGPIDDHFNKFQVRMPEGNRVFVCSAYVCRKQTPFRFEDADIDRMRDMMAAGKKSPGAEREALRQTLAWVEHRVGLVVGTAADRPADDMAGSGDPTQMDCIDVATNLSSYMIVMDRHGLLRHHTIGSVMIKEDLRRGFSGWPHFASILVEKDNGQRYAVDGWLLANGKPPEIVEIEKWYIDDSSIVFGGDEAPASEPAPQPQESIVTGSVDKEPANKEPAKKPK